MISNQPLRIIDYRDFYDIPRAFIIEPQPKIFLYFECGFDEVRDGYVDIFRVFLLKTSDISRLPKDWRNLDSLGTVATLPISAVRFDHTRRREVVIDGLSDLLADADRLFKQINQVS